MSEANCTKDATLWVSDATPGYGATQFIFFADAARINAELYPLMAGRLTETFCHHQTKRILLRCGGLVTLAEPETKDSLLMLATPRQLAKNDFTNFDENTVKPDSKLLAHV